jgi:glucokinase
MAFLLAVDLGGTKSRLGLSDLDSGADDFTHEEVYRNEDFSGIEEVIACFLKKYAVAADDLCLAVAGVVETGHASMTNLPWRISEEHLKDRFSLKRVTLINDLTALAAVIPHLREGEVVELKSGSAMTGQTIGVIAPGTGLGQGYLVPAGNSYIIRGTEGGHSGFTPTCQEELHFAAWMMKDSVTGVSAEQVCAGPGITSLYKYYNEVSGIAPAEWVRSRTENLEDLAAVVVEGAVATPPCPLCAKVIERYLAVFGSEAGNLALKLYARGGLYIGGGVILHLLGKVSFEPFRQAFTAKGKMSSLLHTIPVYVITKKHANVYGTLHYARDTM